MCDELFVIIHVVGLNFLIRIRLSRMFNSPQINVIKKNSLKLSIWEEDCDELLYNFNSKIQHSDPLNYFKIKAIIFSSLQLLQYLGKLSNL